MKCWFGIIKDGLLSISLIFVLGSRIHKCIEIPRHHITTTDNYTAQKEIEIMMEMIDIRCKWDFLWAYKLHPETVITQLYVTSKDAQAKVNKIRGSQRS